jgi:hypothetical protein
VVRVQRRPGASTSWTLGDNGNVGTADLYENDYDAHWTVDSAEYLVQHDLETHERALSFAFFHFPLYTDKATGPIHGSAARAPRGAARHHGWMRFNGTRIYERNGPAPGMPVSQDGRRRRDSNR